jgi:hypothetical protein
LMLFGGALILVPRVLRMPRSTVGLAPNPPPDPRSVRHDGVGVIAPSTHIAHE